MKRQRTKPTCCSTPACGDAHVSSSLHRSLTSGFEWPIAHRFVRNPENSDWEIARTCSRLVRGAAVEICSLASLTNMLGNDRVADIFPTHTRKYEPVSIGSVRRLKLCTMSRTNGLSRAFWSSPSASSLA